MKLYDGGKAPNPRRVRIYLAEKGIEVPLEPIDMNTLGHKSELITKLNPLQRLPVLELDDGTVICETIAICRYFEELHPTPPLFGTGATERAIVEMWQRRIELSVFSLVGNVFRHSHPAMAQWEVPQIEELAESSRAKVEKALLWLNDELADRDFVAGDAFTIADITLLTTLDFLKPARLQVPQEAENLQEWYARVKARPSAAA